MAPSGGKGLGMGSGLNAAEAVRRFPGPPLEDPPTSPPRPSTGVVGGARWDDRRTGCPSGLRSGSEAARNLMSSGGPASGVTPSAATGATFEPLRSPPDAARLRAWRVFGVAIWPVRRAAQSIRAGLFAKWAVARSAMRQPAIPEHGRAAPPTTRALRAWQRRRATPKGVLPRRPRGNAWKSRPRRPPQRSARPDVAC